MHVINLAIDSIFILLCPVVASKLRVAELTGGLTTIIHFRIQGKSCNVLYMYMIPKN